MPLGSFVTAIPVLLIVSVIGLVNAGGAQVSFDDDELLVVEVVAATTPVASEPAVAEPVVFDAVTATRIVAPTSVEVSGYVCAVAPATATQLPPLEAQRCHW